MIWLVFPILLLVHVLTLRWFGRRRWCACGSRL